jgi:SnoaL-like domain
MLRRRFFLAGVLVALTAVRPIIADADAAQKLTAADYIEIQQLYANYAHALDRGEGERFASTLFSMASSLAAEGPAAPAKRSPIKGKDALLQMGSRGGLRHFNANLVITPTREGAKGSVYLLLFRAKYPGNNCGNGDL